MTSAQLRQSLIAGKTVFGTLIVSPSPRWPEAVRGLITGRHAPEVYAELLTGPAQGIKNVISFTAAV